MPFIKPSQAQKHVTHNEALRILDVLTQLAVISDDQSAPPTDPADGARYIVDVGGTGDWSGHDGEVALYETGSWRFFVPRVGWRAFVIGREALVVHDGTDWIDLDSAEVQEIEAFGLGMIAPPETPFSAKLNAALWTALYQPDGGDGALVKTLNKEATGNDLGFVFQQDFETRAILGLFGNDNLRLATSPDGTSFFDGLSIDSATGIVDQPQLPRFKGVTNFDNYCIADVWTKIAINETEFNEQGTFDAATNLFTAPVDGTYQFGATLIFKQNSSVNVTVGAQIIRNGSEEVTGSQGEITGAHLSERTSLSLHAMVALAAGDTVELQGRIAGSDGFFMADRTCFWGCKIG